MNRAPASSFLISHPDGHTEQWGVEDLVRHMADDCPTLPRPLDEWVLRALTETLLNFVRTELHREEISLGEFIGMAHDLLDSFIERENAASDASPTLNLAALQPGGRIGMELDFYPRLSAAFQAALRSAASQATPRALRITGLRACSQALAGRSRWSSRCQAARNEIVSFLRQRAQRLGEKRLSMIFMD